MKKQAPDDEFHAPGFTMKRHGRLIELQTHRTAEEQTRLRKAMWESRPRILNQIQKATNELLALIRKYSSFDLVGNLWLRQALLDMNTYKESESTNRPHFVEHATMLQLREPAHQVTGELLVNAADIKRAEELLTEIFGLTVGYYMSEAANPQREGPPSVLDEARFKTLLREMMVGPPAYEHHWMNVLEALFGPAHVDGYLKEIFGFTFKEAAACVHGVADFMEETLTERTRIAEKSRGEMSQRLKRYMETGKFDGTGADKAMFDAIRNMPSKERRRFVESVTTQWVTVAVADVLSFSPTEIASRTGLEEGTVSKFLDSFSLGFGSTPSDYVIPSPCPAVRVRPIAKVRGNYVCPLPFNLPWAIKPRFEEGLKQSKRWNAYQKHRANVLVDEGLKAIKKLLPASQVHTNLMYPIGQGEDAELDGLVLFDRYAFLVEAKAGEFGAARRGGKDRMKERLTDLIGEPSNQAVRARDWIRKNDNPAFRDGKGNAIALNKASYTEVSIVTLTLDSLDVFTPEMNRLRGAGVLGPHDLPWAVCLADLVAISEILELPSEFTHFLRWRHAVNEGGDVSAGIDELNWLAVYLKEGPEFLRVPQGFTRMRFTSYTDDFDAYFYYREGLRTKPAARPAQPIPKPLRDLLTAIEGAGVQGYTAAAEFLLDLSFKEREQFAQALRKEATRSLSSPQPGTFEAKDLRIVIYSGQQSVEELQAKVEGCFLRDRATLALAVDFSGALRPTSWLILPAMQA